MSRKLTLDINFIDTPRDGDVFGYQISNNGVPLSFNGFDGWDKVFKESTDYTNANGYITMLNSDLTPNTSDNASIGNGFNGVVNVIKRQSTGKYICVGGFTSYQGVTLSSRKICRLNTDFTLDTSFTPPDFSVDLPTLEIDSNDKIYLGSSNTTSGKGRLVRLNANGTLDGGYMPGIGFDRPVMAIKLQPDGKLLVAGVFTTFNSSPAKGIIRLGITGVKDVSFNGVNQGFVLNNSYPRTIDLQSNGDIVIGGDFYMYNNTACGNIIILTSTGAVSKVPTDLDNSPGGILSENVLKVLVDPSDRIYVTGKFERYGGGVACNKIIRLYKNTFNNWVPDLTFNVISQGLDNGNSIYTTGGFDMLLNDNGNLVVVGNFGTVQGTTTQNIAVLDETGILSPDGEDTTGVFTLSVGAPTLKTISNLGDRFILGGSFNSYSNIGVPAVSSQFVIPISPTFSQNVYNTYDNLVEYNLDYGITYSIISSTVSMTASVDFTDTTPTDEPTGLCIIQPDDKAIIYNISYFSGTSSTLIRINPDGTLENTFDASGSYVSSPISIKIQPDGKLFVCNDDILVRLNQDGSEDLDFIYETFNGGTPVISVLPIDNNNFYSYDGGVIFKYNLIGLTYSYDTSYGWENNGYIEATIVGFNSVIKQPDNKILFSISATSSIRAKGGTFSKSPGVYRLNTDGSFDNTYSFSATSSLFPSNLMVLQNDGRLLVALDNYIITASNIKRYNTNGSLDTTYNTNDITIEAINTKIEIQSDNKIILYTNDGSSIYVTSTDEYYSIIRLNTDGSFDSTFNSQLYTIGNIKTVTNYSNNDMLVIGSEATWPGFTNNGNITRIDKDGNEVLVADIDLYTPSAVRMEYTFDNQEIVLNDVYDTTDYVEITYTNESLTLEELVQEIAVRSPYLIVSNSASFSSVNYKIRVYEGSIFTGPSQSINYDITKDKLFTGQSNIYVNINNLVREKLEANVTTFNDSSYFSSQLLPDNMSKWVLVDETIFDGAATQSTAMYYLHALDGYLYNYEQQGSPNVFINGYKRYIHRNQPQRIYFQTNFLIGITMTDEFGNSYSPTWDATNILSDNKKYIQSFEVDPYYRIPGGSRPITLTSYVDYNFTYDAGAGRVYTITKRFEIYDDCKYDLYTIVYKNKFGVLESIAFSRKAVKSLDVKAVDYERSILDYNGSYDITRHTNKQYNLNGYESWVLNTNWMPEYMNEAFEELTLTEEAWIIKEDGSIIPIVKEDTRIDFKTQLNDKLIQYTMKVKMSHQVIKNIL